MEQRKALGRGIASLIPRANKASAASDTKQDTKKTVRQTGPVDIVSRQDAPVQTVSSEAAAATPYREVPVAQIRPCANQPRKFFDEEQIAELAQSIKEKGILHPLVVRQVADGFELISGERRYRAAKQLGLQQVPVLVRDVAAGEQLELALIENLQRADLDPMEEAQAYSELVERFQLTQEDVAARLGRSRSAVANSLRLLRLPERVQEAIRSGAISTGHAKVLLGEPVERQLVLLDVILKRGLSVRQLEEKVRRGSQSTRLKPQSGEKKGLPAVVARIVEELRTRLGTQVRIEQGRDGAGKIIIDYYSQEQLDELYQRLTGFHITKRKISRGS